MIIFPVGTRAFIAEKLCFGKLEQKAADYTEICWNELLMIKYFSNKNLAFKFNSKHSTISILKHFNTNDKRLMCLATIN